MPYSSISELPDHVKKLPEQKQRQWMHVWNSSYSACMRDEYGKASDCEGQAFAKANGAVKGAEMPDDSLVACDAWGIQLEKADRHVKYRPATAAGEACGNCRFFDAAGMRCNLVEGSISPSYTCNLYAEQIDMSLPLPDAVPYSEGKLLTVFVEAAQAFHSDDYSQPMWIPFLPRPGKYAHPRYGEIIITREGNQAFVDSVQRHVYQTNIPMDAEHETKLSGAVGWIKEMRLNEDGSGDAYVEWTERGITLLASGNYKYVSPEWFDAWRDPATGVIHRNVVAGGAITTRPFFKEPALRALVASENGGEILDAQEYAMKTCPNCGKEYEGAECPSCGKTAKEDSKVPDPTTPQTPPVQTFTAAETETKIKEAVEAASATFATQLTEVNTRLEAAETTAASEKEAREAATSALDAMKSADRARRFADIIAGRGGSGDGAAWVGDPEKNLGILTKMAETFGEDSDEFKTFVDQQADVAKQVATALFTEIGSSAAPVTGSAEDKIEQLARTRMAADPSLTHAKAYSDALESPEGKKLYDQSVTGK